MPRTFTRSLSAAASVGVLSLGLVACGGNGGGEGNSATPSPEQSSLSAASSAPTSEQTETVSASSGSSASSDSASSSATSSASASGSAAAGGEMEQAIKSVLGPEAQILKSEQLRAASKQMKGIAENAKITPAECSTQESGASMSFPEDAEMVGGVITDTTDPETPSSEVLSTITFADPAEGKKLMEDSRTFAETCSTFTMEMGQGIKATSQVALDKVTVDGADDVLAHTSTVQVEMEGATLPPDASQTVTNTIYVLQGDTLYQYVYASNAENKTALTEGQSKIEDLRAALGR